MDLHDGSGRVCSGLFVRVADKSSGVSTTLWMQAMHAAAASMVPTCIGLQGVSVEQLQMHMIPASRLCHAQLQTTYHKS